MYRHRHPPLYTYIFHADRLSAACFLPLPLNKYELFNHGGKHLLRKGRPKQKFILRRPTLCDAVAFDTV